MRTDIGGIAQGRRSRIGRIVTDPPTSGWLYLASGYFLLAGATYAIALVAMLVTGQFAELPSTTARVVAVAWMVTLAAAHLAIGAALARRSRMAGVLAGVLVAVPLVRLLTGGPVSGTAIIFAILGVAVIASIWKELR